MANYMDDSYDANYSKEVMQSDNVGQAIDWMQFCCGSQRSFDVNVRTLGTFLTWDDQPCIAAQDQSQRLKGTNLIIPMHHP